MNTSFKQPFVSVIIPVYNGGFAFEKTIESLLDQSYPKDCYEIIVVDNNSTDTTRDIVKKYPVVLLQEIHRQNSYAARNRGIKHAKGSIIAFIDSDCIADRDWIMRGVECLEVKKVDSVGGAILFTFSKKPSVAELTDSLINLDNEYSINKNGLAKTANLFTYKKNFDDIGLFNTRYTSGGDGQWTAHARNHGKTIAFCSQSVVYHPARKFSELIKKHIRVGGGSSAVWKVQGRGLFWRIMICGYLLLPLFPFKIIGFMRKKKISTQHSIVSLMIVAYLCKLATLYGIIKNTLWKLFFSPAL